MYWFELSSGVRKLPKDLKLEEYKCLYNKKDAKLHFVCRQEKEIVGIMSFERTYKEARIYSIYYKENYLELLLESALNVLDNYLIIFKENDKVKEIINSLYKDNFCTFDEYEKNYDLNLKRNHFAFEQTTMELEINRILHFYPNINLNKLYFNLTKMFSIKEIEENKELILDKLYNSYNDNWKFLFDKDYIKVICKYKKTFYRYNSDEIIKEGKKIHTKDNKCEKFLINKGFTYSERKSIKKNSYYFEFKEEDNTEEKIDTNTISFSMIWFKEYKINIKNLKENYKNFMNELTTKNSSFKIEKTNLILYRKILRYIKSYMNKSKYITNIYSNDKPIEFGRMTNIYDLIPIINKRYIDYFIKLGKFNMEIGEVLQSYGIIEGYKETSRLYSFIYKEIIKLGKVIGLKESKNILIDIIEDLRSSKRKNINYNGYLHDIFLEINKTVSQPFMTKKAILEFLKTFIPLYRKQNNAKYQQEYERRIEILDKLSYIDSLFKSLKAEKEDYKDFRKFVSKSIKKSQFNELLENLILVENKCNEEIVKQQTIFCEKKLKMKLNNKKVIDYVQRLRKYNQYVTIFTLINDFGSLALDFIKGTYKGLFKEDYIYPDYSDITNYIKDIFSKKNKIAKKLYHDLKETVGIDKILNNNLTIIDVEKILDILRHRNLLKDNTWIYKYNIYGKIEQKCSPEFLVSGDATVCCMSYHNDKLKTYAKEKGFGIFNVYYKDRIIANSLIWINSDKTFVIDNIEVHPNYSKFNNYIKDIYYLFIKNIKNNYDVERIVQGSTYNDLKLYKPRKNEFIDLEIEPLEVSNVWFYSDAEECYIIS